MKETQIIDVIKGYLGELLDYQYDVETFVVGCPHDEFCMLHGSIEAVTEILDRLEKAGFDTRSKNGVQ